MGLTIEQIIEATNLSKKEIEELKKNKKLNIKWSSATKNTLNLIIGSMCFLIKFYTLFLKLIILNNNLF